MNTQLADVDISLNEVNYPPTPPISLKDQRLILKFWIIIADTFALGLAFAAAFWLRFEVQITLAPEVEPSRGFYLGLIAILIPVWILIFLLFNLYNLNLKLGGISEYSRAFHACTTGTMIIVLFTFLEPQFNISRAWMLLSWLLTFFLVSLSRFLNRRLVYLLRRRGYLLVPTVIVGMNREAATLFADLSEWRYTGLRLLGFIPGRYEVPVTYKMSLPMLGNLQEVRSIVSAYGVEDIIVASTAVSRDELLQLGEDINSLPNVNLRLSSGLYELFTTGVTVKTMGTVPLLSVNKMRLEPEEVYVKTLLDYSLTLAFLLIAWPVLLAIALLIKLDSPGPVFHRRAVLGMSGKHFDALKFRTMFTNGDDMLKDKPGLIDQLRTDHKLKNDPRVTRVGRWLRRFSLDELPQLLNVLKGQMSLVGPRMITLVEAEKYGQHRFNLLTVKPGITGLWQVSGRSDISYGKRVQLDMYYIRNYSVWMDLQILFVQTPPAVLKSRGAY